MLKQLPQPLQVLNMGKQRQIGWSEKEILLHEIYKKLRRANNVAYKWTQGDFHKNDACVVDIYLNEIICE